MSNHLRSNPIVRGEVAALVVAAAMIVVQIAAGVDYPTVPPGLIITILTAALVATFRGTAVDLLGIVVPAFLVVGGFASSTGRASLSDPSDTGAFVGTVVQLVALTIAGSFAVLHLVRERRATGRRVRSDHLI